MVSSIAFWAESRAAGFPCQALYAMLQVFRGFHVGDIDINCRLHLPLFAMLTTSCFYIGPALIKGFAVDCKKKQSIANIQ